MTANWPIPAVSVGSRNTTARVTLGAICFSSSGHFALRLYSNCIKPVMLPPGRAKLATRPAPTGSAVPATQTVPIVFAGTADPVGAGLDDVGRERHQFRRTLAKIVRLDGGPV